MQYADAELAQVMANVFGVAPSTIDSESSVDTIASWDSLRHLNLVIALEEHFRVTFTEDETVEILNYALIKMTLEKHGVTFVSQPTAVVQEAR